MRDNICFISDTIRMSIPHSALPGPESSAPSNSTPVRLTRNSAIVSREVAGETIVVPICRGVGDLDSVYTFNPVGKSLWQLLEQSRTTEELTSWIASNFDVTAEQAASDVQSYLTELQEVGLIRTL
jgi:Coenzyme PQQ synthesis protein D (PqqD)